MVLIKNRTDCTYRLLHGSRWERFVKRGYKYELTADWEAELYGVPVTAHSVQLQDPQWSTDIRLQRIPGTLQGFKLTVKAGYPWDGPSGPTLDTPNNVPGSLPHDALYELMREGLLEQECRQFADEVALAVWREDGFLFSSVWFYGLRWFAGFAARRRK
jgi:hypothetical protein